MQRMDSLGHRLLDTNDIALTTLSIGGLKAISDGAGGCIVTGWRETDFTVRAQQASRFGGLGQIVTNVRQNQKETVADLFQLDQNYPNPFNPSTTINYDLPRDSRVTLKVYDVLGREVTMLVNEDQKAGLKSAEWNATGFASGVYFYRLEAGSFVSVKKLLLLK
jgi:hypothetical protein